MVELVTILTSFVFIALFVTTVVSVFSGAPFVVTNKENLEKIVGIANLGRDDRVVDLGSGDGRIVIEFAQKGFEAHGYEINPFLVFLSRIKIKKARLTGLVCIYGKSFWKINPFRDTSKK